MLHKKLQIRQLISENRPEWMISDLSIMLSGGITVPAYTTYTERDYEYIIDDCTPTVLIISDKTQYLKVKNIIPKKKFIKKIIFFDVIEEFDQELHISINQIFENKSFSLLNFSELKIQRKDVAVSTVLLNCNWPADPFNETILFGVLTSASVV